MNLLTFPKKVFQFAIYKVKNFFLKVFTVAYYYEMDRNAITHDFRPEIQGDFRIVDTLEDLESYKGSFSPRTYEVHRERINKHHDIMMAFVTEGKCVFWVWFAVNRQAFYEEGVGKNIPIPDGAVYCYDSFTLPEFRRKGLYAAWFCLLPSFLKKWNRNKLQFIIRRRDKFPLANAQKFGFRPLFRWLYIHLGPLRWTFKI
jgi:hypothetical protein